MSLLVLSDQHLGSWGKNRERNAEAIQACADFASKTRADICLNGDILDPYLQDRGVVASSDVATDAALMATALGSYQDRTGQPIIYVPGNHEGADFNADDPGKVLGSEIAFDVRQALSVHGEDIALTHGHLLDTFPIIGSIPLVRNAIKQCLDRKLGADELMDLLNGDQVKDAYWKRDRRIDGGIIHPYMRLMRLLGREKSTVSAVSGKIATSRMNELAKQKGNKSFQPDSMMQNAANLGASLQAKVVCVGHDHYPGVEKRWVTAKTTKGKAGHYVVVANSGSALGSKYTATFVDDRKGAVYSMAYDEDDRAMKHVDMKWWDTDHLV